MQCNSGPFIAFSLYVSSVDDAVNIPRTKLRLLWRCCVHERLNNGVFCSRIFLLCASLKYDHILTITADTGIWHAVSQPKQIESVRGCRPKLLNSTWGYTVISTEGIPVNRLIFLFFFFVMSVMSDDGESE
jgi:hypothetical protein